MTRSQKGFTLIELMIVIAIIAIIAAIAIPNLLAARLSTNETAAIATLRQILASQAQFQQGGRIDEDNDGTGEYGGLRDLAGAAMLREGAAVTLVPPVLSTAFQNIAAVGTAPGAATRSGYNFQVYLPGLGGVAPLGEAAASSGYTAGTVNINLAETTWCCYAWPQNYNSSGNRTFFVNQQGDILQNEWDTDAAPGGLGAPAGDDAFTVANDMSSAYAINVIGQAPAGTWRMVN